MTTSKLAALKNINESVASRVRLISESDHHSIVETRDRSQNRLALIMANLQETRIDEESINRLHDEMLREACKLERLMILEGASGKNFFELQKNFRSMVRAANVLIKWFPGSAMSSKMEQLRTEGIELLGTLYEHIKQLEAGADQEAAGLKLDKELAVARDRFMKVYADFAIVFRGMMSVADLFSEDPATVGGYNDVQDVLASLEHDFMLTDEPLIDAFKIYDEGSGKRNAMPGKTGIPDQGRLGKMLGIGKRKGIQAKFDAAVAKAIQTTSPNFNKVVPIQDVLQALHLRTLDQLRAYFQRFNDFVSSDVDTNFLMQVSQNPRGIGSLFKGLWDTLSGAGHMKTMNV